MNKSRKHFKHRVNAAASTKCTIKNAEIKPFVEFIDQQSTTIYQLKLEVDCLYDLLVKISKAVIPGFDELEP